jgi:hypothetical protein
VGYDQRAASITSLNSLGPTVKVEDEHDVSQSAEATQRGKMNAGAAGR